LAGSRSKHKRKNLKLALIAIGAAIVLGMGAVTAATFSAVPAQQGTKFGGLGSAHEHAAFVVKLDGSYIDFSQFKYQVKSLYIHVENGIGTTLHKHALYAPFSEFLNSIKMKVADGCIITDVGERYCQTPDKKLRFFLNGKEKSIDSLPGYVLSDDDRFLVIYGNESPAQIQEELDSLSKIRIFRNQP